MAGKGGGAWKVAYADFVTAMMAFFMVMWLTSQNEAIKEAIAHHFEDPFSPYEPIEGATANKPKPGPSTNVPLPKRLDDKDKKARRTRKPTLMTLGDGKQTTTGTIVYFAPQAAELDQAGQNQLNELLPSILGKPQKIEIRGHSSRRPLPPDSPYHDAWQLSYARCLATMKYLQDHGIGAERIRLSQAGVYEPYGLANGPEKLAQQERVEVNLLNELAHDSLTGADGAADRAPSDEPEKSPANGHGAGEGEAHAADAVGTGTEHAAAPPPAKSPAAKAGHAQ